MRVGPRRSTHDTSQEKQARQENKIDLRKWGHAPHARSTAGVWHANRTLQAASPTSLTSSTHCYPQVAGAESRAIPTTGSHPRNPRVRFSSCLATESRICSIQHQPMCSQHQPMCSIQHQPAHSAARPEQPTTAGSPGRQCPHCGPAKRLPASALLRDASEKVARPSPTLRPRGKGPRQAGSRGQGAKPCRVANPAPLPYFLEFPAEGAEGD